MGNTMALLLFPIEHPFYSLLLAIVLAVPATAVWLAYSIFISPRWSSLRDVPGPPRKSLLWGNMETIFQDEPGRSHIQWNEQFGGAARYHGMLGAQRLVLFDSTALNHVLLSNCYDYPKPDEVRGDLAMILGKGVLFAEGDDHRRQRRIMQPAFSPAHIRALGPIFFEHAYKLRDIWRNTVNTGADDEKAFPSAEAFEQYRKGKSSSSGEVTIDIMPWLSRLTLDIIGMTGFGYRFDSLNRSENKLAMAFAGMFSPSAVAKKPKPSAFLIQRTIGFFIRALPILNIAKWIPNERIQRVRQGFATLELESRNIIESKQDQVEKDGLDSVRGSKDLIALLLKSASTDAKAKMTPEELRGQLTTFLLAGHETTSTSLTWTLWTLSRHPEMQAKLRAEIRDARKTAQDNGLDEIESDELNALPYLDAVTREILRLESPVSATVRHAAQDDVIPLTRPIRSNLDPTATISHISVRKGQTIFIPITAVNHSKEIFGPDAGEFKPERWLGSEGEKIQGKVGVWSSMLTFLAGPRSCIGYKFALLELKTILATLIDEFEFALRDPPFEIERRSAIVMRPLLVGEELLGNRMPLRISLAKRDQED
ncbi:cytochrome P450 [Sporobolomyces koalae]|uniref:cytochrome P450 n=1 Tax=Sporobolomyces koalae TaxID=500713 RepID=UPI00316E32E4